MRTGAQCIVDGLGQLGVERVFGVPGESFLGVLDALVDAPGIEFVTTRHESGAGFMAVADGKLTGRPGVAFVTRGPGAMNAAIALHVAQQDSVPMVMFVGQIATDTRGREAFQEMDYRAVFGSVAKWVTEIDDAARVPELLARAFATATAGRPGPVVLALPEDMQTQEVAAPATLAPALRPEIAAPEPLVAEAAALLAQAERPLVVVGGGRWSQEAAHELRALAERCGLPVAAEFRCQDHIDNNAACYAGDMGLGMAPYLRAAVAEADVVLALGARLGEVPSDGYSLFDIPTPRQALIHVLPEPAEIGRVYAPRLGIVADATTFLGQLAPRLEGMAADPARMHELHRQSVAGRDFPPAPGSLDMSDVVRAIDADHAGRAIVANGAGNYSVWVHKLFTYASYPSQLAPVSGAMGFGVPAAIAAAFRAPDRPVFCFAGDGCFLMTGQELATAVRHRLRVVFLVVNNGMLGTIRMHQERHFPGRVSATELTNPDFADYARAFGAAGEVVERTEQAAPAIEAALRRDGPTVIELRVDPEALTPRQTLSAVRGTS
ncbi:acetolactate synthase II large subunit [Oceanicola granulosus HTCC2516]|uniref:Acetolactate synthase II large subunit n=1 Tax=Oceanicola granulosus (strain ATCC BAA-861 / DSM 15982 / KCTC 12143 / HTCC2516) TaxID=314256 RepID=Q2CC29_OCEGH|nr:thiamine pyrophosphate-dependent enzyme [Oceanicola granulosus]EAR50252.1 acetolactate synthase II large subunit [Oceanicola granulosus HTCC2516]